MPRRGEQEIGHVVVGYDGSDHAKRALKRAAELAGNEGIVAVVAAIPFGASAEGVAGVPRSELPELVERDRALSEARSLLEAQGVRVETVGGVGDPAMAIVDLAARVSAGLIVVGTRGQSLGKRVLLGSVSTRVLQDAPCDVLVVR